MKIRRIPLTFAELAWLASLPHQPAPEESLP